METLLFFSTLLWPFKNSKRKILMSFCIVFQCTLYYFARISYVVDNKNCAARKRQKIIQRFQYLAVTIFNVIASIELRSRTSLKANRNIHTFDVKLWTIWLLYDVQTGPDWIIDNFDFVFVLFCFVFFILFRFYVISNWTLTYWTWIDYMRILTLC